MHTHGDGTDAIGVHLGVHTVALLHGVCQFHALSLLQQVRLFLAIELTEAFHDLILARQVDPLQILLHLCFELHLLLFEVSYSLILRINEELQVLALVLELPQGVSPLQLTSLPFLLGLDDLHVQLVVLFGQLLVLLLERNKRLLIELLVMVRHRHLRLQLLISLSCLQQIVQELLN